MQRLRHALFVPSLALALPLIACERYPEVVLENDDFIGSGGSGDGGQAGAPGITSTVDGIVITTNSTSTGGSAGSPPGSPCDTANCGLGQRCEEQAGEANCVDNECDDLDCAELEECIPANGGGNYCNSIACESDVDCPISRFCDGEKCVDDVCESGTQRCDGDQVFQCPSNGGEEVTRFSCGGDAYFESSCQESDTSGVGCTCEDDWDCPSFTNCEVGTCKGSGVEPTCTLPAVPFEEVLPTLEFRWGGESEAAPEATGSPFPNSAQVLSTPLVINLTDDNDDGFINELDFPEVVFMSYPAEDAPHVNGTVRAVHGGGENKGQDYFALCGDQHWFEGDDIDTGNCANSAANSRPGGGLAAGDLDYDGVPEVVVPLEDGRLRILNNKGEIIHTSDPILIGQNSPGADANAWKYPQVAIANLDNEGLAEIIVGHVVVTLTDPGTGIEVDQVFEGALTQGAQTHDNQPRHLGPNICVVNVVDDDPDDNEATQEIVAGTTLYRLPDPATGGELEVVWNAQDVNGTDDTTGVPDPEAFCAIADVWGAQSGVPPGPDNPLDGTPEVILISEARLLVLDGATGSLLLNLEVDQGGRGGGAPNIDDFDGDGFPEIATAFQFVYAVVDLQAPESANCPAWDERLDQDEATPGQNPERTPGGACDSNADCNDGSVCAEGTGTCVCLHNGWKRRTEDDSSYATGSSVFDFNGDGAAEVVYNDECYFRVYNGVDGAVLFDPPSISRTAVENPVVADVDNDGNAEIVFVTNNETIQCGQNLVGLDDNPVDKTMLPNGVQVWGDANDTWVSARRVWNQHAYHVTNVTEGGGIPMFEPESWRAYGNRLYNTYRSQPRSFGVAPDLALTAIQISSPDVACGELSDEILIAVEVRNEGDLRVGPGVELTFEGSWDDGDEALLDEDGNPLTITLETSLEPGASIIVTAPYASGNNDAGVLPNSVTVTIDEDDRERECGDDSNNSISDDVEEGETVADLRLELGLATGPCDAKLIEVTVTNDGSVAASDVLVRLYAGDPSAGGQPIGEATIDETIEPGESVTIEIEINPLIRNITVFGIADPLDTIPECNDANNRDRGPQIICGEPA